MKNQHSTFLKSSRRRRRGTARLFVLGATFVASTSAMVPSANAQSQLSAAPTAQAERTLTFSIPAGPLSGVIQTFQQAAGVTLSLSLPSLGDIQSPGVSGTMTVERALDALLMGTSITYRFTGGTAAVLEVRQSEQVQVSGRLPTVESPKYVTPLREIPQTIAVVTRDVIESQGATTLSEALRNVPGITMQAGEGGGASSTAGDMFNLRGFNAANSLFVDGVRDDGLISRDVFNVEQVEVFMGPTGSDVGRTTAAGYVNMQSKTPHLGNAQSVLLGFGSADQARVSADFNVATPMASSGGWFSKVAARFNVLWQDSGVAGRDETKAKSKAVAPALTFGLNTRTRLALAGQFVRQDNLPDYGVPGAAWLDEPLAPTTVRAPSPVALTNYYGSPAVDYDKADQNSGTVRLEHDFTRSRTLRNQTRYNQAHREAVITTIQNPAAYNPATNLVTLARQGNERENKIFSNQTSLLDRFTLGSLQHATSLGFEIMSEEQFAPALGGVGTRAPVDIFHPNPADPVVGFAPARTLAMTLGDTDTVAVYAFDTIELSSRWQANGGLRLERYNTAFKSVDAVGLTTADLEASDTLVSGKVGLLFRLGATANIYGSFGNAVTPPGTANFTLSTQPNNVNNPNVEPQRSRNLELGAKWDHPTGRLSFNTAIFRTDNTNVIFTVDATAIPPVYNQDDAQRVSGITVGTMGMVTEGWQVFANFAYLDSASKSQNPLTNGRALVLTPEVSGSVWTTYRVASPFTIGGGVRFTDEVFINTANTIISPAYTVVDALAEYAVNSHLSLRLNFYNIANETYIRSVNNNGGRFNPGFERSMLFTSNVKF